MGSETLPITLGEKKALILLKLALSISALVLLCSFFLGWIGPIVIAVFAPVIGLSLCLLAYEKHWLSPGLTFEGFVEGNFLMAGLVAVLWWIF